MSTYHVALIIMGGFLVILAKITQNSNDIISAILALITVILYFGFDEILTVLKEKKKNDE